MKTIAATFYSVLWFCALVLLFGACSSSKEVPAPEDLPTHTIVYGGDVTNGRRINDALFNEKHRNRLFGDVEPLLEKADIALVNGEGVIAKGGYFYDKGEPRPYMYRAHPIMIDVLKSAGVDIVAVGNNHAGDYGPEAFAEMLDRLSAAGIAYTGGGHSLDDARQPAYFTLKDTVVAFVGADLTVAKAFRAEGDKAGTLFHRRAEKGRKQDRLVRDLAAILKRARKYAHVVLFTPHWGDNWIAEPTEHLRTLAKRLIKAGYDGILGHSSHWLQGVEIIEGKPVMYDAGNLVVDYGGGDDSHRAMLWKLSVTRAGVTGLTGYPLALKKNRTNLAKGAVRDGILRLVKERSKKLGTTVAIENGIVRIACRPGGIEGPAEVRQPPKRPKGSRLRLAPSDTIIDALPPEAVPVNVTYEGGIKLIGYQLIAPELTVPKAGQIVALYWKAEQKIDKSYRIHLEARGKHEGSGKEEKRIASHLPGDWLLPTDQWPPGKVIRDWTLIRLKFKPEGTVKFYAGLSRKGLLKPESSDQPLVEEKLVPLGSTEYRSGSTRLLDAFEEYRRQQSAKKQP